MNKAKPAKNSNQKTKRRKKVVKIVEIIGMNMDEIYSVINITQLKRIEQELIVDPSNSPIIENILKDCQISFQKETKADGLHYVIQPPPERKITDDTFIFPEDLEDEIIEDDDQEEQIFKDSI